MKNLEGIHKLKMVYTEECNYGMLIKHKRSFVIEGKLTDKEFDYLDELIGRSKEPYPKCSKVKKLIGICMNRLITISAGKVIDPIWNFIKDLYESLS